MTTIAAMVLGLVAGYLLSLVLDYAYRDGSMSRPAGTGRPARRRAWLLPPAGAVVVVLVWSSMGGGWAEFVSTVLVGFVFLALAATDFERHLLPNRLIYPAIPLALLLAPWLPAGGHLSSVLGAALGFVILLVPHLAARGALGAGDVKLGALVGAFAGAWLLLPALMIGAILGAVGCLVVLLRSRTGGTAIAYGPYLAFGALAVPLI